MLEAIDKNNLHHAYLLEGTYAEMRGEILALAKSFKDSELIEIRTDAFKIEDARNLKSLGAEKSFSVGKKIFVLAVNSILLDAQNTLLKLFEEPIPETHFFVIVPDANSLLKTLVSRFYVISTKQNSTGDSEAGKFLSMPSARRIEYLKEKIARFEDEEESVVTDSLRAEALRFLNSLEYTLSRSNLDIRALEHIFKVRKMLRMPGSSVKNLMESVALITPVIQDGLPYSNRIRTINK